ncbi:hypothetical protein K469DRAFT_538937, partial [Zopfia rhizophila CBS 207.26]
HHHSRCNQSSTEFPINARAIDCETRTIVPLTEEWNYIALSYVLGKQSLHMNESEQVSIDKETTLPSPLPITIEDAITNHLALNFRSLWVDHYCIAQHHFEDKMHQVRQMANIYDQCRHDLFGSTWWQLKPNHASHLHLSNHKGLQYQCDLHLVDFKEHLRKSVWGTRGWTYREGILSRRCLFFMGEQVYLVC